jgi:hypothetical protein
MRLVRSPFAWATAGILLAASSPAQTTQIMSVDSNGVLGNNYSGTYGDAISADGRFVAFGSGATNLIPGGSPLAWEIFLHDRLTGGTVMVSVDSAGNPGTGFYPSISADGSCVAFESGSGFGTGDTNGRSDVFVHDFTNGQTTRMSVDSNGQQWFDACTGAAISGDGRYVAFQKLHPTSMYHFRKDLYLHDRQTGNTAQVNINTNGVPTTGTYSYGGSVSFDGRLIAFTSTASDLVAGDTNASYDIFVRDMQAGVNTRVSLDSSGAEGNGDSLDPSISSDGRCVAFSSAATNLVPGDANAHIDIFVHNIQTGETVLASVDSNGVQANADCLDPVLSADGRYVTFHSTAMNLVANDTNNADDVFVRDLLLGTTECVSVGLNGTPGNGLSDKASISSDGRYVSFVSFASNLAAGDTNGTYDVFARDRGSEHSSTSVCFGEGTQATSCPCANSGAVGHGCANSGDTAGALLAATGTTSPDVLVLGASQMLPNSLCVYLQGDVQIGSSVFGDGVRCVGGQLLRLAVKSASSGASQFPEAGDLSISARSAALGDVIPAGGVRYYQTYYRDPSSSFCPAPSGNTWNVTNGVAITW